MTIDEALKVAVAPTAMFVDRCVAAETLAAEVRRLREVAFKAAAAAGELKAERDELKRVVEAVLEYKRNSTAQNVSKMFRAAEAAKEDSP